MKINFFSSAINILFLCLVIFFVSLFFIFNVKLIGWISLGLGLLCLFSLLPFKFSVKLLWPDIVFGLIDNGILAILAIFGGELAGTTGAVIGGVIGNALTDGVAGIFEGLVAEKMKDHNFDEKRTMLGSSVGKMAGCLFGAGVVLIIASFFYP